MRPEEIARPAETLQINHPEDTPARQHDDPDTAYSALEMVAPALVVASATIIAGIVVFGLWLAWAML